MAIFDFLFGQQGQAPQGNGLIDSRVAEAMANPQTPSPSPSPSAQAGGVLSQMNPGILSDPQGPGFMKRLGNALMAAGSRDPSQTLLELQRADNLAAEARKPKVTFIPGTPFAMITAPDGSIKYVKNDEVEKYLDDKSKREIERWKQKTDYKTDAEVEAATRKAAGKEQISTAGDSAQTNLAVTELEDIANSLGKTDTATGPAIGLLPKPIRDIVTPDGAALQDRAERIIQASLRATLGAQFTEKEGARFLERAYNPRLSEAENAKRLRQVAKELSDIQANKEAALEYLKKNGSLEGFKPPASNMPGRGSDSPAPATSQPKGLTAEEVKAINPNAVYEPGYIYQMIDGKLRRLKVN